MSTCRGCGGDKLVTCDMCGGKGGECPFCRNSGKKTCDVCKGTGQT